MKRFLSLFFLIGLSSCGGGGGGSAPTAEALSLHAEPVIANLNLPVGLAAANDGRLFFSELGSGQIRVFRDGEILPVPFARLDVPPGGLEGTLGIALDADFATNGFLYVFTATGSPLRNRVIRFRDRDGLGVEPILIVDDLPNGGHNGGKIVSARDGHVFVSTGDAGFPSSSQSLTSLAGKILRFERDGGIPLDNPIPGSSIFALGFRNVFGLAIDPRSEKLFASDNGPDCDDEINIIQAAGNYGWRDGQPCGDTDPAFIKPLETLNPPLGLSGIAFYRGAQFPELFEHLLIGDFNTGSIRQYLFDSDDGSIQEASVLFSGNGLGVLEIAIGPDGTIYFSAVDGIYRLIKSA